MGVDAKTSAVYKKLRALELAVAAKPEKPWQEEWQALQKQAMSMKVPKKYAVRVYELRMYLQMVEDRLAGMKWDYAQWGKITSPMENSADNIQHVLVFSIQHLFSFNC